VCRLSLLLHELKKYSFPFKILTHDENDDDIVNNNIKSILIFSKLKLQLMIMRYNKKQLKIHGCTQSTIHTGNALGQV
jgi:hypothetical protein